MNENRGAGVHLFANLAGLEVGDGFPVRILGAINVSPESFYKGSIANDEDALRQLVTQMDADGADMIDVGAMSTAPYLETEISEAEEIRRLLWAVGVLRAATTLPISVDTKRSRVALAALDAGAAVINDVSGFRHDPAMAQVAAQRAQGAILMASENSPGAQDPIGRVRGLLQDSISRAVAAGLPEHRVVLDPGIGFFRDAAIPWHAWDCEVVRRLGELRVLGRPILVGVSRKSFIGKLIEKPDPSDRLAG
ncbi:MAG: dihydropteroate synthase, partial [Zetaproteobacteria bacterium]